MFVSLSASDNIEGIFALQKSEGLVGVLGENALKFYLSVSRDGFETKSGRVGDWPRIVALPERIWVVERRATLCGRGKERRD